MYYLACKLDDIYILIDNSFLIQLKESHNFIYFAHIVSQHTYIHQQGRSVVAKAAEPPEQQGRQPSVMGSVWGSIYSEIGGVSMVAASSSCSSSS